MRPAVFLDRDGVLSRSLVKDGKAYAPRALKDFRLMPGAADSVKRLQTVGFLVVVVTNQPDIGNNLVSRAVVNAMNQRLRSRTSIDHLEMCTHSQNDGCACRKPKPGMLLKAAQRHGIDLKRSFMVGDRSSDIAAGQAVGCCSVFIDRGYRESPPRAPDACVRSLIGAVDFIVHQNTML